MMLSRWLVFALITPFFVGCGKSTPAATINDAELAQGKQVWEGTCRTCHLNGLGGAPKMGNRVAWAPRIEKGLDVLIMHAQQGFEGQEGTMPPRGGNANLSDSEVAQAARYMVANSR